MYDLTVIIPTFREERNIRKMVETINTICKDNGITEEILVVDDNSPDATQNIVREIMEKLPDVHLLVRASDPGLSQSLYAGMNEAKSPFIQCIDCDFSHPPDRIPFFYQTLLDGDCDMVIGSRYVPGGSVVNWPLSRRILSFGAALLGRVLIPHVHDSGSGYFALKKQIIENVTLKPRGFRMGFEILGKGNWTQVREIPICFQDRVEGQSKMRLGIVFDYLKQWVNIISYNISAGNRPSNIIRSWKKYLHLSS